MDTTNGTIRSAGILRRPWLLASGVVGASAAALLATALACVPGGASSPCGGWFHAALRTDVVIDAPAEDVWKVLMDFPSYPDWNPFVRSIAGRPVVGTQLTVVVEPPGYPPSTFEPEVLEAEPGVEFRWLGHLVVPGLLDGHHGFRLEPLPGGRARLIHDESFSGLLVPLLGSVFAKTEVGMQQMDDALKLRAEASRGAPRAKPAER
jgi:hypothetical protein